MIVQKENGLTDKGKISTSPPRGQNPNGGCPQAVCHVELRRTRAARQRGFCSSTSSSQPGNNGKQGQNKTWGASSTQELFCKAGVANSSGCFSPLSLSVSVSVPLSRHQHAAGPQQALAARGSAVARLDCRCPGALFPVATSRTGAVLSRLGLHGAGKNDQPGTCGDGGAVRAAHTSSHHRAREDRKSVV